MSIYSTASLTMLGGREEQQDAYCLERRRGELLAAVCDGIGGLPGRRGGQPERRAGPADHVSQKPAGCALLPLPAGD